MSSLPKSAQTKTIIPVDIKVDLSDQIMTVYRGKDRPFRWKVSTGTKEYPTPIGNYKPEFFKKLYKDEDTKTITMHYAIFFHDSHAIVALQPNQEMKSHSSKTGGVKLNMSNAKTLFELVVKTGAENTNIRIVK
jgi:hypothetical protein